MASRDVTNVTEYEELAKQKLPKATYDYYATGAEDLWTLRENIRAFQNIRLRPRIMVDVSHVDTSTDVLGFKISSPIMVAPTSLHRMAHPEGELATARAAAASNTILVLSSRSNTTLEDVEKTGPGIRFFQLYISKNRDGTRQVIRRAERAGYKAIVLTADVPYAGNRELDTKNRFAMPSNLSFGNFGGSQSSTEYISKVSGSAHHAFANNEFDQSINWKDVGWLRDITSLPILIKGVLTAEDASLAVQHGVAGIIVSNHGGRQLNYAPPTIDVLDEVSYMYPLDIVLKTDICCFPVVEAVKGTIPVFLDGGIRRGTDVFKALALGAAGVFVGRPVVFGLAVDGEAGVRKVLQMLKDEFELAMSLSGCCRLQDISRAHIRTLSQSTSMSRL